MVNWWIIGIFVFIGIVLFKSKEIKHRIGLLIVAFLLIFLILSSYQLYSKNDLDLTSFDGVVHAGKVYFNWLGSIIHNIGNIGGYAIQQNWSANATAAEK